MKILMLSTDRNILDVNSSVARRMMQYGTLTEKLTILVLGKGERAMLDLSEKVHVLFPGGESRKEAFKNALWEGMREAREGNVTLVSVQDPFFVGFVGWRIARALHTPLQVQIHTDVFSSAYFFASLRKAFEVLLSLFILSQASCVRVVSHRIKKSISFLNKEKVVVLPIRVKPFPKKKECPEDFKQEDGMRILMVSRLEPEKRIHRAIESLIATPNAHLYIIGEGALRGELEDRARNLSLEGRVHFLGWKEDVAQYYFHADVFLQLSQFEGYGISLIEAGLAGLPIITTDVGVVGEVFSHHKSALVVSGSKKSILDALAKILADIELQRTLGSSAREQALKEVVSGEEYLGAYKESFEQCSQ